jgi:hypothetical protein
MTRSSLVNLKNYDITLTTSWETKHGVSGHMFELIEYFMHLRFTKNLNVGILLSDGTTWNELYTAVVEKYELTQDELVDLRHHTHEKFQPKCLLVNTLLIVDGSLRTHNADIIANKIFLFRCAETDIVRDNVVVLQDNDVYDPLPNSIHYKKKILFDKYSELDTTAPNTAMFYLTNNSRLCAITTDEMQLIVSKHKFDNYIALTNKDLQIDAIDSIIVPVRNLWNLFSTYIYTNTALKFDCSPRFVAECEFYNKEVIYEIDYHDKGLVARLHDMKHGDIWLRVDDEISTRL